MLFDHLAVRLNGPKATGKVITLNVNFTDLKKEYGLTVENAVLNYVPTPVPNANSRISLTKATLDDIQLGNTTLDQAVSANDVTIDGNRDAVVEIAVRIARLCHSPRVSPAIIRRITHSG
jgi:alkyl sulfatase BDS1-like metallo-beta-lactamase superfamily hydrolase